MDLELPSRAQRRADRDAHLARVGLGILTGQFSEELHTARDIILHGDQYPREVVDAQHEVVRKIFKLGINMGLEPQVIADACEEHYEKMRTEELHPQESLDSHSE